MMSDEQVINTLEGLSLDHCVDCNPTFSGLDCDNCNVREAYEIAINSIKGKRK